MWLRHFAIIPAAEAEPFPAASCCSGAVWFSRVVGRNLRVVIPSKPLLRSEGPPTPPRANAARVGAPGWARRFVPVHERRASLIKLHHYPACCSVLFWNPWLGWRAAAQAVPGSMSIPCPAGQTQPGQQNSSPRRREKDDNRATGRSDKDGVAHSKNYSIRSPNG